MNASVLPCLRYQRGEEISTHVTVGDAIVQILDGEAHIVIGDVEHNVKAGETLIMPSEVPHSPQCPRKLQDAVDRS